MLLYVVILCSVLGDSFPGNSQSNTVWRARVRENDGETPCLRLNILPIPVRPSFAERAVRDGWCFVLQCIATRPSKNRSRPCCPAAFVWNACGRFRLIPNRPDRTCFIIRTFYSFFDSVPRDGTSRRFPIRIRGFVHGIGAECFIQRYEAGPAFD